MNEMIYKDLRQVYVEILKEYYNEPHEKAVKSVGKLNDRMVTAWLNSDITDILVNDADGTTEIVLEQSLLDTGIPNILDLCEFERAKKAANIRKDFATALRKVRKGTELAYSIGYAFSDKDIKNLAELHKKNKFRKKIENLLEDCNFHTECANFIDGKYDAYLKEGA